MLIKQGKIFFSINTSFNYILFRIKEHLFFFNMQQGVFSEIDRTLFRIFLKGTKEKAEDINCLLSSVFPDYQAAQIIQHLELSREDCHNALNTDSFIENNRPGNFWMHITDYCNMRCVYCYHHEQQKSINPRSMSFETAKQAVDLYFTKYAPRNTAVNFFGGEPTLNFSLMKKIVPYIDQLRQAQNRNVNYSIVTNGINITDEIACFLKQWNFFITVSVDGGPASQDRNRKLACGEGSFNRVESGVETLLKYNPCLAARITVTGETVNNLYADFQALYSMGFDSVAYKLVSACTGGLQIDAAGAAGLAGQIEKLAEQFYHNMVNGAFKVVDRFLFWMKRIYSKPLFGECPYALNGKMIVDPRGDFYGCQETVGDPRFVIGNIREGVDFKGIAPGLPPLLMKRPVCRECWVRSYCDSMCYYACYAKHGTFNFPLPEFCSEIRESFLHSLILYARIYLANPELLNTLLTIKYNEMGKLQYAV